jgi:DNA polymerase III delta subunit
LIAYKSNNLEKVNSEINKLLITKNYIEIDHIIDNIFPELEESIFQFIDDILNKNIV